MKQTVHPVPLTYPTTDDTWVTTNNAGQIGTNNFLNSVSIRSNEASVMAALSFLRIEGYITQEEYTNRKSDRLNDIRTYYTAAPRGGVLVVLVFDDNEWVIKVEVDSMLNIIRVELHSSEEED